LVSLVVLAKLARLASSGNAAPRAPRSVPRTRTLCWQQALQAGLRPVAAGLILATVYVLLNGLDGGWSAKVIALMATALVLTTRVNALFLIACGAALFVLLRLIGLQ
jgi:chromate transporter